MVKYPDYISTIRVPFDLWEQINKKVEQKMFRSIPEALRTYCQLGMKIEQFKEQIKDPEFLKSIDELKRNDSIFEWLATLSSEQKGAIKFAIEVERDALVKQTKFV